MIQADNTLVKSDYNAAPLHGNEFYRQANHLTDELLLRYLKEEKENFPTVVMFPGINIQPSESISDSVMSPFIGTKYSFNYDAGDNSKKYETKSEMRKKPPLLSVERHFSPTKNSSSD